jgi:hypothetical protein
LDGELSFAASCRGGALSSVDRAVGSSPEVAADPRYAWLSLALPADARSFWTDDGELAALLVEAGLETRASRPDVEIASADGLRGDAVAGAIPIYRYRAPSSSRIGRIVGRLTRGAALSVDLRRARRAARLAGYTRTHTIRWERSVPVVAPGIPKARSSRLAHRLPLNGVVVADRESERRTLFDEVLRAAGEKAEVAPRPSSVGFGSSGVVVAKLESVILRVGIGPGAERIAAQRDVVARLLSGDPSDELSTRLPASIAAGREGIATWTLEQRLTGAHTPRLEGALAEDAIGFLAELGRVPAAHSARPRIQTSAEVVGRECSAELAERVHILAADAAGELAGQAARFVHGDFWHGNLLAQDGRLTGVIDWSAGGPDGLPMADALHLHLSAIRQDTGQALGSAVAEHLLSTRTAEANLLRSYERLAGLELTDREWQGAVVAYWLDALARDLRDLDAPRGDQASWERENVVPVLRATEHGRRPGR